MLNSQKIILPKAAGWKEFILVFVTIVFTLAFGEVAARLILPPPYKVILHHVDKGRGMPRLSIDPQIGWVNTPEDRTYHFRAAGKDGVTDAIYHVVNGFRATSAAPRTGPIVITAGCSFTFGVGVNDQDTWPWLVQEHVPEYRFVNAGTNNYGTVQSVMLSDRLISDFGSRGGDSVKAVLLGFAEFHLSRDAASQAYLFNSYPAGRPRFVKQGDRIAYKGLVYFWTPGPWLQRSDLLMDVTNRLGDLATGTPRPDAARDITLGLIDDFVRRSRQKNIAVGVVMLPSNGDRGPLEKRDHDYVYAHLRQAGIPVLAPDFPRLPDGKIDRARFLINSDAFHPNRDYNLIVSDQVSRFLKSDVIR